jgi:predicted ATPase/DNA-binding SARP family transcriptional activator
MSLEIRLLGTLDVRRDGRPVALPPSKKTRALLAYLVATARPQPRAQLCELLWDGPDDPRAALRWSLTKIRPVLDDAEGTRLLADSERAWFEPANTTVDLTALRHDVGSDPAAAPTEALAAAAERFHGEFLEELDLPDCYRYHEWWIAERESIRALRVAILATLVDRFGHAPETALQYARARLLVDPFSEAAHIAVIELLGRSGRSREALQQYESCRRMLDGQFGARPTTALERTRAAIGSLRPASSDPPLSTAGPSPRARPMVGRRHERERIAQAIAAAQSNASRDVLWITGEAGIGKTRLLEDLADQVRAADGIVLAGRAYEAEMVRPYGAWIDALRSTPLVLAPTDPAIRSDLALLLPELGGDAMRGDRHRLFDAVAYVLHNLTRERRPVVLVLDDIQWFDETSAGLLHFVARALAGSRVLIACGARTPDLHDNAAVMGVVRALRRDQRLCELPLDRLDAAAIHELVGDIDPRVDVGRVFAESEGNALFAIEIARALARGDTSLSDTVEELILDRLALVDERARGLVPWAAALGRSFSPEILRLVSGLAPAELVGAMDELERRGVIRAAASPSASYDFTHDLIRRAAYRQLSEPRRRIVHLQLARTLGALPDPEAALAGDVAHHAALGGDAELAATASVAAGERSLRLFAYAEASALAERGMEHADRLARDPRIHLHMALLRIAVHASVAVAGARNREAEISRLTREAQDAGLAADAATGFYLLSFRHHVDGDYAAAHADTLRAAEAGRGGDAATAARALGTTGRCLALIEREIPRAEALLLEARALAEESGVILQDIPWGLGLVRAFVGDYDEAVRHLETAVSLAQTEQDHWAQCECLQRLALIELERGAPRAARARACDMARVAAKMGEGSEAPIAAMLQALTDWMLGEPDADDRVEDAIAVLRRIDAKALLSRALLIAAAIDLDAGYVDRAANRAEEALLAAEVVGRRSEIASGFAIRARVALAGGDLQAATRCLNAAGADLRDDHAIAAHARRALEAVIAHQAPNRPT